MFSLLSTRAENVLFADWRWLVVTTRRIDELRSKEVSAAFPVACYVNRVRGSRHVRTKGASPQTRRALLTM
jgi:hypothetical protein